MYGRKRTAVSIAVIAAAFFWCLESAKMPEEVCRQEDFILPHAAVRYYSEKELGALDAHGLYLARNELYACHGFIFRSPELKEYFTDKSWYVPEVTKVPVSEFNPYETSNLELIRRLEAGYGKKRRGLSGNVKDCIFRQPF